ncbi:MAG: monovalent cation/H(+) antiporter subunit G [bacterium]|nr:monovalent cation/H(+) antiporter subunit G [bacterium]
MGLPDVLATIVISLGAFFLLIGSVGLVRLPDFFSRTHATGKSDTLGIILILLGLILTQGISINGAKLLIILAFVALTNPTATNALAKAAFHDGLIPWFKKDQSNKENNKKKEQEKE